MNVIGQVAVLFFLIFLGYICIKLKVTGPEAPDVLSRLVMDVTMPCLVLVSFQRPFSTELLGEAGITVAASLITYGLGFLLASVYPRLLKMRGQERGVHRYAAMFSNCGYIGLPIVEAVLGAGYLFHACFFNISFNFFSYTLGVWFIAKEGERKMRFSPRVLVTPVIITTVIGLVLFLFSVKLPLLLRQGLNLAGDMTSPLSMLVIGMNLARTNVKQIWGRWQIYVTTILRLLVMPAVTFLVCRLLGIRGAILTLTVVLCGCPAAAATSILAALYKSAPEEGSALVFMTTLLSIVTIPLLVFAINMMP